ncbi:MAG TPA: zf-HC2 domain-containing protein [Acidimicrobiales bacterium]|nr:zf-HC2 domain-containing protein [Acidimicrobiales bacterium]
MTPWSGAHPDDLLSAHVDDELPPAVAAAVEAHVATCAGCRDAEQALRDARSLLRSLPAVDAAPVIEGFLARHRAIVRSGAGFVGVAAVALLALALNAATHRERVVPEVDAIVAAHLHAEPAEAADMDRMETASYQAPPGLIGSARRLSRHEVYDGVDVAAAVYRDGDVRLSVYQQPGRLDWDRLPIGSVETVGDRPVWFRPGAPVVAVTEKGDLVLTVVSDDRAAVLTAVGGFPEWRRRTAWDRVHDACQRFARVFTLDG